MLIPGLGRLVTWLTFPGVMVHEYAHKIACERTGTRVTAVCYFRFGNPAGFVEHEPPPTPQAHLLIGTAPFLVNSVAAFLVGLLAVTATRVSGLLHAPEGASTVVFAVLSWLAISIGAHAFPSTGDAQAIWHGARAPGVTRGVRIATVPIVGFIYFGALASVIWFDVLYGLCAGSVAPLQVVALIFG